MPLVKFDRFGNQQDSYALPPGLGSIEGAAYLGANNFCVCGNGSGGNLTDYVLTVELDQSNKQLRPLKLLYSHPTAIFNGVAFDGINIITSAYFTTLPPTYYLLQMVEITNRICFTNNWNQTVRSIFGLCYSGLYVMTTNRKPTPHIFEIWERNYNNQTFNVIDTITLSGVSDARDLTVVDGDIYFIRNTRGSYKLSNLDFEGNILEEYSLTNQPRCICNDGEFLYIGQ